MEECSHGGRGRLRLHYRHHNVVRANLRKPLGSGQSYHLLARLLYYPVQVIRSSRGHVPCLRGSSMDVKVQCQMGDSFVVPYDRILHCLVSHRICVSNHFGSSLLLQRCIENIVAVSNCLFSLPRRKANLQNICCYCVVGS
jgi:hypothetical protein